jgi:hypothetical protein
MNKPPQIKVMISSRSKSRVFASPNQTTLEGLRRKLQGQLHALRWVLPDALGGPDLISDDPIFDVWIHENDTASSADNTFERSLKEIRRADIIIVLYTGEAGSAEDNAQIGICHAELQEALARRGAVVHIVELEPTKQAEEPNDVKFRRYVSELKLFHTKVEDEPDLLTKVRRLLHKAVAQLTHRGARGKPRLDRGQPLDWNRLDLVSRQRTMRDALAVELRVSPPDPKIEASVVIELAGRPFGARLDAIPAALSVAAARELVGQPFHRDHRFVSQLSRSQPGVIHLIACHRGVTEAQATRMLGTPDAIAVPSDFGVYAADHVQHIQVFLLAHCADESAIGVAVRRLDEWLRQTGEIDRVARRAEARRKILLAVSAAGEVARGPTIPSRVETNPTKK